MADYRKLHDLVRALEQGCSEDAWAREVLPHLVSVWLSEYAAYASTAGVVETQVSHFSYVFDIAAERLIAAWGVSRGQHEGPRDASRMAGHPNSAGPLYHRGHAIAHSLGGLTDINLIPQLGRINVGAFRSLEKRAAVTPGSLYFTYWSYIGSPAIRGGPGQTPTSVDQGLLIAGHAPLIRHHRN